MNVVDTATHLAPKKRQRSDLNENKRFEYHKKAMGRESERQSKMEIEDAPHRRTE